MATSQARAHPILATLALAVLAIALIAWQTRATQAGDVVEATIALIALLAAAALGALAFAGGRAGIRMRQVPPELTRGLAFEPAGELFRFDPTAHPVGRPVMLWGTGADGRLTFANVAWRAFLGVPAIWAEPTVWRTHLHPADRIRFDAASAAANAAGCPFNIEHRCQRADGEYRWL